jgi:gamma-glutamyl phosphate reductase
MPVLIGGIGVAGRPRRRFAKGATRGQRQDAAASATRSIRSCTPTSRRRVASLADALAGRASSALRRALVRGAEGRQASSARRTARYGKEWLSLIASVKVVDSYDDAVDFIYRYSSGHSDAIVTENYTTAMRFLREVDTAVCYVNASTQFTDGTQFGLGAEIIDATQKFHARGPVGLREICTYKWIVFGNGHVRPA